MRLHRLLSLSRNHLLLVVLAATAPLLILLLYSGRPVQSANQTRATKFELQPNDHVCLIGNTLADRMQHDGWLETFLHAHYPKHDLVFRNLGFSADELTIRLRSANFGSPDQWLSQCKADVVFAFFGYNESFAGEAGLDKFKKDLDSFVKDTLSKKYNGKGAPRLVLFSPIAHENLKDRNLPDGSANNPRIEQYSKAMAEIAQSHGIPFVDLFAATRDLYAKAEKPLTINGIHLNSEGNRQVARAIERALHAGEPAPKADEKTLEKLRQAVVEKNFYWFNRYRTTDGYSIFGGRADLKFVGGQTNRIVAQREMEVLDVMTANRDKKVWAAAQGKDLTVDDNNTPPFIPVITNKPGPLPGGGHVFLDGDESIKRMTVAKGLKVNLFVSEKEFPEFVNPVQMAFDPQGRLWVAVWQTYPHWKPKEEMNDKLLILEDTNGDGKADKCTTFADGLHNPTGFEFYNGGVLIAQAPDLVYLKDTNNDGKADVRQRVISGLDSADTHHTSNSFTLDPGGAVYFQEGTFHHTQVETPYGAPQRVANGAVFRYEPRAQKFEVYVSYGFANPHGHVFDRWGQDIVVDGTGAVPYHAALFSGFLPFPTKHSKPPQVYQQRTRPCPGIETLSSRHFPEENQGNLLVANVIGFQGILQYKLHDKGASFGATEVDPILSSTDPNFRPSDLKIGPDGAIYFLDWHNPIIGHMQHNLRDPSRDRTHGRVYRVTVEGRELLKPVKIAGEPIEKLLDLLKEPEDRTRYRVRVELGSRDSDQVIAAAKKWAAALDPKDKQFDHNLLEALWVHQSHNVVDAELLRRVLGASDFRARAAATRVLCYWRDRLSDSLDLLKKLAADSHPRVRLEAIRAASFFTVPEAIEVVLISQAHPTDVYLDFLRGESMKALDPLVKKAIAAGHELRFTTPAGARYFLKNVGTEDLLKMKRTPSVFLELLFRKGIRDEFRREALAGLSKQENRSQLLVLLGAVRNHDGQQGTDDESVAFDLVRLLTDRPASELAGVRGDLEKLVTEGRQPVTRQLGFVALIAADGNVDKAWALAMKSAAALQDMVNAMPLVRDAGQRASLYPKVEPLLKGLPKELSGPKAGSKAVLGRYVRVELPGKMRTLTLAEVEVFSDGKNIARQGKATQKSTGHNGAASRGIDGNKSGTYTDGGQTHTQEGTDNPWWEVDLGGDFRIDAIAVYNRTDGALGNRLKGHTLKVLDRNRNVVFQKDKLPAPEVKSNIEVSGESPDNLIRKSAMLALTSVRGQETETFKTLARFVKDDNDRYAAVQAIQRIPANLWPKDEAKPLLQSILAQVRKVPPAERTTAAILDTMQLADALASLLPLNEARTVRKELGELGVRVLRVGTVVEQMRYDVERIVVKAGKPFEILFENSDMMPHNLVITQPGALEEIGNLAETTATMPGAAERQYVPPSKKILLASRLLQPRDSQRLSFTAPAKPGVYPIVCTYPGHWRRMYGAMYVVEDLDEYLADAEGYLAKHPLPIADELLKFVRPRTEWKYDDLSASIEQLKEGRSFNSGKQMFQVASCVACHKLGGVGTEMGPDLTKPDPKLKPVDILREVMEPSHRINEKFQSWVIATNAGKTYTGLILEETPQMVKLIENPLAKSEPVILKKSDIAERQKSPTSIMPKGLLDKLTREEILDLMAYVLAAGDQKSKLFQGGHDHGHGHQH